MSGRGAYVPEFIRRASTVLDTIDRLVEWSPWKLTDKAKFEIEEVRKGVRWLRDRIETLEAENAKLRDRDRKCPCCGRAG